MKDKELRSKVHGMESRIDHIEAALGFNNDYYRKQGFQSLFPGEIANPSSVLCAILNKLGIEIKYIKGEKTHLEFIDKTEEKKKGKK